jgi:hypothetical protein
MMQQKNLQVNLVFLFSRRKLLKIGGVVYFLFPIFSKKVVKTVIIILFYLGTVEDVGLC